MSAERNAVPMPNATTSARFESGRAMSGRTGMSLASTVSSVIEVPATHSSGVALTWPAWTDAISSSVEAKSSPPADRDERLVRLHDEARPEHEDPDDREDDTAGGHGPRRRGRP